MSYYFAVMLRDSILFSADRTFNDKLTGINRSDLKRYSLLSNNRIFLPSGNLFFCRKIEALLHSAFEFDFEPFESGDLIFSEFLSSAYQKIKEDYISRLQAIGKTGETENVDCLYGGLHNGTPFIISVSSADGFKLRLIDKPMQFVCLNQKPEILEFVAKTLKAFMGAVGDKGTNEIWDLGRKFLPSIIQKVSKADPLVSVTGDLIFVTGKGIQTYQF